jgi:hypothetical protein
LLADLFLYSYETEIIQKLLHEKNKLLAVALNSTFRYQVYRRCFIDQQQAVPFICRFHILQ